jgi:hypothetical protein
MSTVVEYTGRQVRKRACLRALMNHEPFRIVLLLGPATDEDDRRS